ncbi:MAG: hypothetical protein QMD11_00320 [Smithella sp.]|nr:hypothetical protein [Smithella sp.]
MKRYFIAQQRNVWVRIAVLFLMTSFLIMSGCAGGGEDKTSADNGTPAVYQQEDLAGKWSFYELANEPKWTRTIYTVDPDGSVSCESYDDSAGITSCSDPFDLRWTVASDGTITESGVSASSGVHMSMTSDFNLIAGTGTAADASKALRVVQRIEPSVLYDNEDLRGKTFVYHGLVVGTQKKWIYGEGSIDAGGAVTINSETDPNGAVFPVSDWGTISVGGDGIVTLTGLSNYKGFLSADKKTITGTFTDAGGNHQLTIIQVTGHVFDEGPLPSGVWKGHSLVVGNASYAPFWLHHTATVDETGTITFSNWASSEFLVVFFGLVPDSAVGTISSSGTIVSDQMAFHGQASDDNKFMVCTQTPETNYHALTIYTDTP